MPSTAKRQVELRALKKWEKGLEPRPRGKKNRDIVKAMQLCTPPASPRTPCSPPLTPCPPSPQTAEALAWAAEEEERAERRARRDLEHTLWMDEFQKRQEVEKLSRRIANLEAMRESCKEVEGPPFLEPALREYDARIEGARRALGVATCAHTVAVDALRTVTPSDSFFL